MKHFLVILCGLLCLSLNACEKTQHHHQDLIDYKQSLIKKSEKRIAPLKHPVTQTSHQYQAQSLRSPFASVVAASRKNNQPKVNRPKQALETFSLNRLTFIGTISQQSSAWALIAAPDNKVYKLKVGDYMGKHFGRIIKITDGEIILHQFKQNAKGDWLQHRLRLTLADKKTDSVSGENNATETTMD